MDIAAMSMFLNQAKLQQQVSTSVYRMALDNFEAQGETSAEMIKTALAELEAAVEPNLGRNLDVRV